VRLRYIAARTGRHRAHRLRHRHRAHRGRVRRQAPGRPPQPLPETDSREQRHRARSWPSWPAPAMKRPD